MISKARTHLFPCFVVVLIFVSSAAAQICPGTPGCLDPTFGGGDGTVAYSNPLVGGVPSDFALQSDAKLVSLTGPKGGADSTYSLIRINADGSLDTSFNGTGTRSFQWGMSSKSGWIYGFARAVGIQTIAGTERIVVAGQAPKLSGSKVQNFLRVDRYMPDGSNDTSFGTNGTVYLSVGQAYDIEIQSDQKIVGVTIGNSKVFRLNANGTLDTTFGSGGIAAADGNLERLAIDNDGSILVAAQRATGHGNNDTYSIEVRKFRPNGTLDSTFGSGGAATFVLSNYAFVPNSIVVDPVHNILVGAREFRPNADIAVVRFTQNGLVDTSFASSGIYIAGLPNSNSQEAGTVAEGDGKVILMGSLDNPTSALKDAIAIRLNYDGSLDPTFGSAGKSIFDISGADFVVGGRGGLIQIDPLCACEKLLITSGTDYLTTFARLTIY
jgi:uncharacterized delta-60 repeat protein